MPKVKISEFSSTPANNTDIDSINISEGCAPSGINDAIRELMAQLKDFQTGAQGDSFGGPISGAVNATVGATTPNTGAFTTLSATGVTTVQAGTAALPAITTTGDTNTGIFFPAADTIAFSEGGVEAARIDSSGNLGLGVTPSAYGTNFKAIQIGLAGNVASQTGARTIEITSNAYNNSGWKYQATDKATLYYQYDGGHAWSTAASGTAGNAISFTQAMTLDASGNLLVGTTTQNLFSARIAVVYDGGASGAVGQSFRPNTDDGYPLFFFNAANSAVGNIRTFASSTTFNSLSDYRLKTVIGPVADAGRRIDALQPVEYEWKSDGLRTRGFLAHQFQEVYAGSVTGSKDAVDAEGKPVYQAMQASSSEVIADLVAEIQSLRARVAQLESN